MLRAAPGPKPTCLPLPMTLQLDFYLGLNSHQFMGNSVSSFSAMLIMERWHNGKYAGYYNGGNVPMEIFLPLYQ